MWEATGAAGDAEAESGGGGVEDSDGELGGAEAVESQAEGEVLVSCWVEEDCNDKTKCWETGRCEWQSWLNQKSR